MVSGQPYWISDGVTDRHLPESAGLRFYNSAAEAAEALRAIERDYAAAAREARRLAEEFFATAAVLPALLTAAGA